MRRAPNRAHSVTRDTRVAACVLGLLALGASQSAAQSRAGLVLSLPTSARALGLGQGSAAAMHDEWSLFLAPAQLGRVRGVAAGFASEGYLASTLLSAAAIAVLTRVGTVAFGATMLDYGTIQEIASSIPGSPGAETGRTWSARDYAVLVGLGRELRSFHALRVGGALEFVHSGIADVSGSAVAASVGAAWTSPSGWDIAASAQHFGGDVTIGGTSGSLPRTLRAGVAAPAHRIRGMTLRPMAEFRTVNGGATAGVVAGELSWAGVRGTGFSLRAGYTLQDAAAADHWPVALGAGITLGKFAIDYATERFSTIDQTTHRVGLRFAAAPTAPSGSSASSASSVLTSNPR